MRNSNRKIGTSFEHEFVWYLAAQGFWCHLMSQNSAGQPFDVIAARNGKSYPIDCKACEHDAFRLVRIEENQLSAMTLWRDMGNGEGWFALKTSDGEIYMIPLCAMETYMHRKTVMSRSDILSAGMTLKEWVMAH